MAGPANLIKAQIYSNLLALKTAGTLGYVIQQDVNIDILTSDIPGFPCAILGPSSMQSVWEFPQSNRRTYVFDIMIIQLKDNLAGSPSSIEDLRDTLATYFDNNVTLNGLAPLGVQAVVSDHHQIAGKEGQSYVIFYVTIKATTLVSLTYNF